MPICPSCNGILGRDCFNPQECAWIAQMEDQRFADDEFERHVAKEYGQYISNLEQEYIDSFDKPPNTR